MQIKVLNTSDKSKLTIGTNIIHFTEQEIEAQRN